MELWTNILPLIMTNLTASLTKRGNLKFGAGRRAEAATDAAAATVAAAAAVAPAWLQVVWGRGTSGRTHRGTD